MTSICLNSNLLEVQSQEIWSHFLLGRVSATWRLLEQLRETGNLLVYQLTSVGNPHPELYITSTIIS